MELTEFIKTMIVCLVPITMGAGFFLAAFERKSLAETIFWCAELWLMFALIENRPLQAFIAHAVAVGIAFYKCLQINEPPRTCPFRKTYGNGDVQKS